jgi:uroporphyrin-III C-methyltransferase/precorrin-2 dehydrogenase/sirohydrochlorin ferrochelatase
VLLEADVIVYDRLASAEIVALGRAEAERIYAGKERDHHCMSQGDISHLLVDLAKQNKRVVRLKGGDPFIFGRGGEEAQVLAENGVDFEVVPGITSACGVAAFAGIPLTHRDYAHSCVFVTGHLKDGTMNLDWEGLARPNQTVVVYMGLVGLPILCRELVAHGVPKLMPAAMVQQGTMAQQRVVVGTLDCLPGRVVAAGLKPPALTIVGEVVGLRDQLAWFESLAAQESTSASMHA